MYSSEDIDRSEVEHLSLFARARGGDESAWYELYQACYPKVLRAVRRRMTARARIQNVFDSADFASDVWKSLAAKKDRYDFPNLAALIAFLQEEAGRKVKDGVRHCTAQKRCPGEGHEQVPGGGGPDDVLFDPPSTEPTPSQFLVAAETHERIMAGLTETEQMVINFKRAGYSVREIADMTGWHIRRVQRFLKERFDQST